MNELRPADEEALEQIGEATGEPRVGIEVPLGEVGELTQEPALETPPSVVEPPRPLTAAAPRIEPPLVRERDVVTVRVDRAGFATVDGQRVFVARNLAGATVQVERPL